MLCEVRTPEKKQANNNNNNTPPPVADGDESPSDIDTATRDAAVAQVKRQEQETIARLGYDPFKPLISSNMNPSPAMNSSAPTTPTTVSVHISGRPDDPLRPEVEEALGVVFSHSDHSSSRTCIETILKLCRNIYTYPLEKKYRYTMFCSCVLCFIFVERFVQAMQVLVPKCYLLMAPCLCCYWQVLLK